MAASSTERILRLVRGEPKEKPHPTAVWSARASLLLILPRMKRYATAAALSYGAVWLLFHWEALAVARPYFARVPTQWVGVFPLAAMGWRMVTLACIRYEITPRYLRISHGVFSRWTDQIDLYRVKKAAVWQPWWLRVFRRGMIVVRSSDPTLDVMWLEGIKKPFAVREELVRQVDLERERLQISVSDWA